MELKEVINIIQYYEEAWLEGKATIEKENKAQEAISQVLQWYNDYNKWNKLPDVFHVAEPPEMVENAEKSLIVTRLEQLIERLSNDTTSEMADCNQYCINELDKILYKGDTNI